MIQLETDKVIVFQSALYMTTSTIIRTDEAIFLIDPCWLPTEIERVKEYVDNIISGKQLYIIYTHSDFDHIIASGFFENAIIIASEKLSNRIDKEKILQEIKAFDEKYYINRSYTPSYPVVNIEVKENGQQLKLKNMVVTFYLSPGHTEDGLFIIIEPFGIFLSGDYLSDVEFPFINSSYTDYVQTLKLANSIVENHSIQLLVPGHGSATEKIEEINERISFSQWYLQELKKDAKELLDVVLAKYPFAYSMIDAHEYNKSFIVKNKK
ncbi:MAG: MBL fold metallo-hydrolase [Kurthia sp.]|nr:MBL fold metallo-hydrolase [Candidatus Kurthia equi]